jgi:hypothetical protein
MRKLAALAAQQLSLSPFGPVAIVVGIVGILAAFGVVKPGRRAILIALSIMTLMLGTATVLTAH